MKVGQTYRAEGKPMVQVTGADGDYVAYKTRGGEERTKRADKFAKAMETDGYKLQEKGQRTVAVSDGSESEIADGTEFVGKDNNVLKVVAHRKEGERTIYDVDINGRRTKMEADDIVDYIADNGLVERERVDAVAKDKAFADEVKDKTYYDADGKNMSGGVLRSRVERGAYSEQQQNTLKVGDTLSDKDGYEYTVIKADKDSDEYTLEMKDEETGETTQVVVDTAEALRMMDESRAYRRARKEGTKSQPTTAAPEEKTETQTMESPMEDRKSLKSFSILTSRAFKNAALSCLLETSARSAMIDALTSITSSSGGWSWRSSRKLPACVPKQRRQRHRKQRNKTLLMCWARQNGLKGLGARHQLLRRRSLD